MEGVILCVLLWAQEGHELDLIAYEDTVLRLLTDHGARVLQRARTAASLDQPLEVQLLSFPSDDALQSYMSDARRTALSGDRDRAVAKTEVLRVSVIAS